jgi:coenzyme F420-reducing hydrogenase beta subunit
MHPDEEGFLYPIVNLEVCIGCNLCVKVCPAIYQGQERLPLKVYASRNKDERILLESSSGGIFSLLASVVIRQGGVVFGVRYDKDWNTVHSWTDSDEGLADFRGAKYVQSRIGNTYKQVLAFLKQDRWVLFSGTSCQISALNRFLKKKYEKLLTVELVCHGVPSTKIWQSYLMELTDQGKNPIRNIQFRGKDTGWKEYSFVCFQERGNHMETFKKNPYMKGFIQDLYLRPSCYQCPSKSFATDSDLALADFWGVQYLYPQLDDDLGIGTVFVHSLKAEHILEDLSLHISRVSVPFEDLVQYNKAICFSSKKVLSLKRKLFFLGIDWAISFSWLANLLSKKWGIVGQVKKIIGRG